MWTWLRLSSLASLPLYLLLLASLYVTYEVGLLIWRKPSSGKRVSVSNLLKFSNVTGRKESKTTGRKEAS